MTWDEENRLMGINDNGRIHQYTYDAGGERVIKSSGDSQNVAVNGQTAATIVHTDDYTGYVSPYFVINKGKFTKYYFEGAGRIVSKLGNGAFAQPLKLTAGGVNYTQLTAEQQKALDNYVKSLGVPPGPPTQQGIYATPEFTGEPYPSEVLKPAEENQEPPEGWPRNPVFNAPGDVPGPPVQFGPPIEPTTVKPGEGFTGIGLPENDIFYFHPDHLGSTSYISNKNGSISQHVEYIAFGEVFFEEHSSSFSSPYLFNGKELDRETNLSNFGARYLDMKTSLWLTVDSKMEKYPSYSSYCYVMNNPINAIDPDGREVFFIHGTSSNSNRWTKRAINTLMRLTNNKHYNSGFNWKAPLSNNKSDRTKAAKMLAAYVIANHKDGEEITLAGHSHGGNVAIQAADIIYKATGQKVNILTIATPAYNGNNDVENPKNHSGINDHIALWNNIDGVSGGLAGDDNFTNSNKTKNIEINVNEFYKRKEVIKDRWGNKTVNETNDPLGAHSFDVDHPESIDKAIQQNNIQKLKPVKN